MTTDNDPSAEMGKDIAIGLFDAAPLPMMLCAIEDAAVLVANRRAQELFAGPEEGRTIGLDDILGKETTTTFLHNIQNGGFIDDFEVMLNTPYGEQYCGTVSGQIVTHAGHRRLLVGMNDITDRKQAEETLRRFFDGAPLAMLLVRMRDHQVIRINRRASELFPHDQNAAVVTLESHLGKNPTSRFLEKLTEGGFVESFECGLATGWGQSLWASLSGQIIEIDDERCVLIGLRDITDRKRWEEALHAAKVEAEQATQAKSQFLATMSHEIRTPMNGVLGMIDVLSNTPMSDEQKDMVSVISDSARTLLAIIDDILDLSKIEAGKMSIEQTPLRLRQTVETTVELVAPLARAKGLEIAWRVSPDLADDYLGDPTRLRQILLNLLSNAVKFTDRGRVIVRLGPAGDRILFEIEDTGIGMTEEQQARLFQPFSQADASTTRRFGGTGLGLAICKKLVNMMDGDIALSSVVGEGSRFSFAIPLAEAPIKTIRAPVSSISGLAMLVADPLAESRGCMADALRAQGVLVTEVGDAQSAASALRSNPRFDAALVDATFDPAIFADMEDPPAVLLISAEKDGAVSGDYARQWSETGLTGLAKPIRWSALTRAVMAATDGANGDHDPVAAANDPTARKTVKSDLPILIAEDNHTNRIVIARQLDYLGFSYDMVEDGEAALTALAEKRYALLLADCRMPKLDGYALTRCIREREEDGQHLPVVALTANALADDRKRCLAAGMDDYLAKPVRLDKLEATLLQWLPSAPNEDGASDTAPPSAAYGEQVHSTAERAPHIAEPVDCDALGDLLGDNSPELLSTVLASFLEFFPALLERAVTAVENQNREALHDAVHAAKGAARSACAPELAAILAALEEKAGSQAAFDELGRDLDLAGKAYADVRDFIGAYHAKTAPADS
ncbi:ATP-binding protein [Telmatospirillum siberiense]|uniref:Sensory/regulatory protein RpfC n=1 Tax=Telmatospirillum siberiense TaxID=382514 RepID=A0A2N3Q1P1_9PROT|nr:ATP-binding protein [Telmatospirillum siberiense]PKU26574.1 hypothetical protein CWS72_01680 [Telmatospirillum siberiense]